MKRVAYHLVLMIVPFSIYSQQLINDQIEIGECECPNVKNLNADSLLNRHFRFDSSSLISREEHWQYVFARHTLPNLLNLNVLPLHFVGNRNVESYRIYKKYPENWMLDDSTTYIEVKMINPVGVGRIERVSTFKLQLSKFYWNDFMQIIDSEVLMDCSESKSDEGRYSLDQISYRTFINADIGYVYNDSYFLEIAQNGSHCYVGDFNGKESNVHQRVILFANSILAMLPKVNCQARKRECH